VEVHIRAFEIADATSVSGLIATTLRISNVKDYPADFLSKVEASLTPPSLCELAKERVIFVAVGGNAIVGTASLGRGQVHAVFVHPARRGYRQAPDGGGGIRGACPRGTRVDPICQRECRVFL
jgi:hypothetical protein